MDLFLLFERDLTFSAGSSVSNSKTSAKAGIIWVRFCTFAIIFRYLETPAAPEGAATNKIARITLPGQPQQSPSTAT